MTTRWMYENDVLFQRVTQAYSEKNALFIYLFIYLLHLFHKMDMDIVLKRARNAT